MEFLFAAASLLAVTVAASFIYHRRIKQAQGEYEGAKDMIKSITLGFTRQLNRLVKAVERIEEDAIEAKRSAHEALRSSKEALDIVRGRLEEERAIASRLEAAEKAVDHVKTEIQRLSNRVQPPTAQVDVKAPIPLQRDTLLEQLTETEIKVLTIIDELGEGAVPEIRERIRKTREHTARLLKKLYEKGFIDRNTSRMPYRYYIRKEIKDIVTQQKRKMKIAV